MKAAVVAAAMAMAIEYKDESSDGVMSFVDSDGIIYELISLIANNVGLVSCGDEYNNNEYL